MEGKTVMNVYLKKKNKEENKAPWLVLLLQEQKN